MNNNSNRPELGQVLLILGVAIFVVLLIVNGKGGGGSSCGYWRGAECLD